MQWPRDNRASLDAFYSAHELGGDGTPTAAWEARNLVAIEAPYSMALAWEPRQAVTAIRCHRRVAETLSRVLRAVLAHYGDEQAVRAARMHLFGGCYCYRRVGGASRLSVHSWAAAVDLDPDRNTRGWHHGSRPAMMPQEVVRAFEAEGWTWGGHFRTPDCMHFQAAVKS